MKETLRFGRVFGIPVGVNWTFLLIGGLVTFSLATMQLPSMQPGYDVGSYWSVAVVAATGFFASIVAHEFGHALVARREGVSVHGIVLWLMGGVAKLGTMPPKPAAEARIAVAGPLVGFGMAGLFWLAAQLLQIGDQAPLMASAFGWLAIINVVLSIFNLIPAAPLDGGRVLSAFLWWRTGDKRSAHVRSAWVGRAFALLLIVVGIWRTFAVGGNDGLWLGGLGFFLFTAAQGEIDGADVESALDGLHVGDIMSPNVEQIPQTVRPYQLLENLHPYAPPTAYLVHDDDNRTIGLLTMRHLHRLTASDQSSKPLGDLVIPVEELHYARADDRVTAALTEINYGGLRKAVVVDQFGRPIGYFGAREVDAALRGDVAARPLDLTPT